MKTPGIPTSAYFLLFANLVPLAGVVFGGWSMAYILFLYWAESAIVGFFNILKMLTAGGDFRGSVALGIMDKVMLVGFFIIHFGGFMAGHGVFLYVIFSDINKADINIPGLLNATGFALAGLFISHGYSFIANYCLGGEIKKATVDSLMSQPYSRIVVMQLTIIFGMLASAIFGNQILLLAVFVALKTGSDLQAHLNERKKFADAGF